MIELTEQEQLVIKAMRRGWDIDLTLNEKPESIQDELREIGLPYEFILEYFSGGSDGALGFWSFNITNPDLPNLLLTIFDK